MNDIDRHSGSSVFFNVGFVRVEKLFFFQFALEFFLCVFDHIWQVFWVNLEIIVVFVIKLNRPILILILWISINLASSQFILDEFSLLCCIFCPSKVSNLFQLIFGAGEDNYTLQALHWFNALAVFNLCYLVTQVITEPPRYYNDRFDRELNEFDTIF